MKNQIINFFKECPMELKPIFIFTGIAIIQFIIFLFIPSAFQKYFASYSAGFCIGAAIISCVLVGCYMSK